MKTEADKEHLGPVDAGNGQEECFPRALGGTVALPQSSSLQNCERVISVVLSHSVCGNLLRQPQENNIDPGDERRKPWGRAGKLLSGESFSGTPLAWEGKVDTAILFPSQRLDGPLGVLQKHSCTPGSNRVSSRRQKLSLESSPSGWFPTLCCGRRSRDGPVVPALAISSF